MIKAALSLVDVFKGLEDAELELLEKSAKHISMPSERIIFKEGDAGDKMFLVVDGVVEIWKSEGKELKGSRLARLKPGEIFGEMSLFDQEPRSATAVTAMTKETVLTVWDLDTINHLIKDNPVMGLKIMSNVLKKISTRLRVANDAIHTLLRSNQYISL